MPLVGWFDCILMLLKIAKEIRCKVDEQLAKNENRAFFALKFTRQYLAKTRKIASFFFYFFYFFKLLAVLTHR